MDRLGALISLASASIALYRTERISSARGSVGPLKGSAAALPTRSARYILPAGTTIGPVAHVAVIVRIGRVGCLSRPVYRLDASNERQHDVKRAEQSMPVQRFLRVARHQRGYHTS